MSVKANVVANYVGQAWRALMGLAFIPLYIKYLGIEAYGLMGIFAILQAWLVLLDMGMRPTLSREMARYTAGLHKPDYIRDLLRSVESLAAIVAVLIVLVVCLSSNWLATHWLTAESLGAPAVGRALILMGILIGLRFIESVYSSTVVGLQRQVVDNAITVSTATLRAVGAIGILAYVSPTIEAFFIWQAVISVLTVSVYRGAVYWSLPKSLRAVRFSRQSINDIWRFAGGMTAIAFLSVMLTQVDKILLSKMLTLKAFSYYALAATIANSLYLLVAPITTAFYPRFTELATSNRTEALKIAYHQAAQFVTVVAGAAAIILMLFASPILLLWSGDPILTREAAHLLPMLSLGTLFNALMWVPYQMQLAHGWTSLTVKTNLVAVIILVPAILWFVPRYGSLAAAWIWMTLNAGYLVFMILFMHRRILRTEKWIWYLQDLAKPLTAGLLAGAIAKWAIPMGLGKVSEMGALLVSGVVIVGAQALAAPVVREMVFHSLTMKFRRSVAE